MASDKVSTTHLTFVDVANGKKVAVLTMDSPPVSCLFVQYSLFENGQN